MTAIEAVPTWIFLYAGLFALVHLVVGYYLYRRSGTLGGGHDSVPRTSANQQLDSDSAVGAGRSDAEHTLRCGHCHTENDPGYRYCRNCVQELPSMTEQGISAEEPDTRESL